MTRRMSFASACLAVLLSVALVPFAPLSVLADQGEQNVAPSNGGVWPYNIDDLLEAGPYVEGEALVLMGEEATAEEAASEDAGDDQQQASSLAAAARDLLASAESLTSVSAEAVEAVVEPSLTNDAEASDRNDASTLLSERAAASNEGASDCVVVLVRDKSLSTRELLEILAADERVIMAQPNYRYGIEEPGSEEESSLMAGEDVALAMDEAAVLQADAEATSVAENGGEAKMAYLTADDLAEPVMASSAADLSSMQWAYDNRSNITDGTGIMVPPDVSSALDDFDVNAPNWNDEGQENAAFVVAIADTGVDYTHPDLAGAMLGNMEQYNPDGGYYGYDAVNYDDEIKCKDPMDVDGHGTHVAGIIAAEWNGAGTSGIANGVKLVPVVITDEDGYINEANYARACEYLSKAIDGGLNLAAVNNSWGSARVSGFLDLLVTELGTKGVISVFTSGNDGKDTDNTSRSTGAMHDNPYMVSVGSSDSAGSASSFSSYGKATTDLFAPGEGILSTVDQSRATYQSLADSDPLVFHSFAGEGLDDFKTYSYSTAKLLPVYQTVQSSTLPEDAAAHLAYDAEGGVLAIPIVDALVVKEDGTVDDDQVRFVINVTVSAESEAALYEKMKRVSFAQFGMTASDDSYAFIVYARTFSESDGEGMTSIGVDFLSKTSWTPVTLDFGFVFSGYDQDALLYKVEQVGDEWKATLNLCFAVLSFSGPFAEDACLYIDAFGMGNTIVPYDYKDGTSMAAPVVTGAAAVLAARYQSDTQSTGRTAEDAAELAALVKGSVRPAEAFEGLCTSGGHLDLSVERDEFTPAASTVRLVEDAEGYVLEVSGWWFGEEEGSVAIDGVNAEVLSWSDSFITLRVPEEQEAAVVSVSVTAQNGRTGLVSYCLDLPVEEGDEALPLFEKKIDLSVFEELAYLEEPLLTGLGGDVYMLLRNPFEGYRSLYCYDPSKDELSPCASMPLSLFYTSMTTYDGKLFVMGSREEDVSLDEVSVEDMALFCYDAARDQWEEVLLPEDTPLLGSIVNFDETLLLLGGVDERLLDEEYLRGICALDLEAGETTVVGFLASERLGGLVTAVYDETLYVTGGLEWDGNLEACTWVDGALNVVDQTESLPWAADSDEYDSRYALASTAEGLLVVGYDAVDENDVLLDDDVFLIGSTEDGSYEPFGKRPLRETFFFPRALAYDGWLYAAGSSYYQDNSLVLVATPVETLPLSGDVVVPDEPVTPDEPDEPVTPGDPDEPVTPSDPVEPDKPATPEGAPELPESGDEAPVAPLTAVALIAAMALALAVTKLRIRTRA